MNEYMKIARQAAEEGIKSQEGGPFGAVVINTKGEIISIGHNEVLKKKDPTAHAEIVAIREACQKLDTYDLSGYILYTVCEPCPMCLAAIIWSNIKEVVYGCTKEDANTIGFKDEKIYQFLKGERKEKIKVKQMDRDKCMELFHQYEKQGGIIY